MPTILQINVACNWGSTGRIAEQIGVLAQKNGWDAYLAHGARYVSDSRLKTIRVSRPFEEKVHGVKSLLLDAHGLGSVNGTKAFVGKLDEIKPDIVHLHNIHGYFINYEILFDYLRRKDIPIVWTLHDCWSFTGHCMYFDRVGCDKWKTGCHHCPQLHSYPKSLFIDRSSANWERRRKLFTSVKNLTLVPVSNWLGDLVSQSYLGKYPVRVIHNGIDINVFKPTENDLREMYGIENKFVILGVASGFGDRKGLDEFIKLSESLPSGYQVMLVGTSFSDQKRVPSNIIALRNTDNVQELVKIYSTADVFLNPTYEDNFPTTNLEALACGTPVITYRTGGSPEAVDKHTGIVVEKGDFDEIVFALETVRENGKSNYSIACRERAIRFYNKDERFKDYIVLYKDILKKQLYY